MKLFTCIQCGKQFKGDSHWKKRPPRFCSRKCMGRHYVETGHMKKMSKKASRPLTFSDKKLREVYNRLKKYSLSVTEALKDAGISQSWGSARLKRLIGEEKYSKIKKYRYKGRPTSVRGTEAERFIASRLRKKGFKVCRSAGSKGLYDLIAYNEKELKFIQVKRSGNGVWNIGSKELNRLKEDKIPFGEKEVYLWVDGNRNCPAKIRKRSV